MRPGERDGGRERCSDKGRDERINRGMEDGMEGARKGNEREGEGIGREREKVINKVQFNNFLILSGWTNKQQ